MPNTFETNEKHLAKLHPELVRRVRILIKTAAKDGFELRVVQGLRTFAEQDELYKIGRTKKGARVTNARGGGSWHNYGLACDLAPVIDGRVSWDENRFDWSLIGKWARAAGLSWGGAWLKFRDRPHVELKHDLKIATAAKLYWHGGLAAVWRRVSRESRESGESRESKADVIHRPVTLTRSAAFLDSQDSLDSPDSRLVREMMRFARSRPEWFVNLRAAIVTAAASFGALTLGWKAAIIIGVIAVVAVVYCYRRRIAAIIGNVSGE